MQSSVPLGFALVLKLFHIKFDCHSYFNIQQRGELKAGRHNGYQNWRGGAQISYDRSQASHMYIQLLTEMWWEIFNFRP